MLAINSDQMTAGRPRLPSPGARVRVLRQAQAGQFGSDEVSLTSRPTPAASSSEVRIGFANSGLFAALPEIDVRATME
jgi:hypothetical protein